MIVSCKLLLVTKVVLFKSLSLFKTVPSREVVCHRYGKLGRSAGSVSIICWLGPPAATNSHCELKDVEIKQKAKKTPSNRIILVIFITYIQIL